MKPLPIPSLLLASALLAPWLQAQDASSRIQEIERKVLLEQRRNAVQALVESANETKDGESGTSPDLIGRRLQWLAMVDTRIQPGGGAPAATNGETAKNAGTLNDLAWNMITSPDAAKRHPDIALKLADLAIDLGGGNADLKPKVLDTKARALFAIGRHEEAIAGQEQAIAAATAATTADEKAGMEATLAAYKKGDLPEIHSEGPEATNGMAYIVKKLHRLVVPRIDFEDVTVEEAIHFLRLRASELDTAESDPSVKGVNFVIRRPRAGAGGATDAGLPNPADDLGTLRVRELRLRNVPLDVALKYICEQTKLRFKVDDFAVTLISQSEADSDIFTRAFEVPPDFFSSLNSRSDDRKTAASPAVPPPIIETLKSAGIHFGEGCSVALSSSGTLLVTNTPGELDKVEQLVAAETAKSGWNKWTKKQDSEPKPPVPGATSGGTKWTEKQRPDPTTSTKEDLPEVPASAESAEALASKERREKIKLLLAEQKRMIDAAKTDFAAGEDSQMALALQDRMDNLAELSNLMKQEKIQAPNPDSLAYLVQKLKSIVIPAIDFENVTVREAVDFLRKRAAELDTGESDPSRKGLNFVVREPSASSTPAAGSTTGEPPRNRAGEPGELRIGSLHLRNVPIGIALKYICDITHMRYRVDDFAVTLVAQSDVDAELLTRTFHVPTDFADVLAGPDENPAAADPFAKPPAKAPGARTRPPIIELLKSNGINFGEGSSVTLTSKGMLMVTNTAGELDKIELLVTAVTPAEGISDAGGGSGEGQPATDGN